MKEPILDLTGAVIVAGAALSDRGQKALALLVDEVEKRTQIRWTVVESAPEGSAPMIAIGSEPGAPAEGYRLQIKERGVTVTGADARGVLFGIGRLLRGLQMTRGRVSAPCPRRQPAAAHWR